MICRFSQLKSRNPKIKVFSEDQFSSIKQSAQPTPRFSVEPADQFNLIIQKIKEKLQRLSRKNQEILEIQNKYIKSIKESQCKQFSNQIDTILKENEIEHDNIKTEIKKLNDILEYEDEQEPEYNMKKNLFLYISDQFAKIIQKQKQAVNSFRLSVREKVGRQVRLVNQQLDQKKVEYYIDHPEQAHKMLQQKIYGQASNNLKNAVSDIQDKLRDIQKLQKSINHCLELFKYLESLVAAQGEMIDNIQINVNHAKDYVNKGMSVLIVAKKHHKHYKKKTFCIFGIVLVVLLIIIVPIAISIKK